MLDVDVDVGVDVDVDVDADVIGIGIGSGAVVRGVFQKVFSLNASVSTQPKISKLL